MGNGQPVCQASGAAARPESKQTGVARVWDRRRRQRSFPWRPGKRTRWRATPTPGADNSTPGPPGRRVEPLAATVGRGEGEVRFSSLSLRNVGHNRQSDRRTVPDGTITGDAGDGFGSLLRQSALLTLAVSG